MYVGAIWLKTLGQVFNMMHKRYTRLSYYSHITVGHNNFLKHMLILKMGINVGDFFFRTTFDVR